MISRPADSALSSMTGFARTDGQMSHWRWVWEAKSVNGKGLDVRLRLPPGYDVLEQPLRSLVAKKLGRGNVTLSLQVDRDEVATGYRVNKPFLEELIKLARELEADNKIEAPRLDTLLAVRGVIEAQAEVISTEEQQTLTTYILGTAENLLDQLTINRQAEGRALADIVKRRLQDIERLWLAAEQEASKQPTSLKERLEGALKEFLEATPALSEDRLAQEIAILAAKADIREELDRLKAHIDASSSLLRQGGAIGRRLDFLCQELGREANTLCAKAQILSLTQIGLELKAAIEQLREQVQNLE